jgi:hypothetical protein
VLELTTSGIDNARSLPQLQFDCNPFRCDCSACSKLCSLHFICIPCLPCGGGFNPSQPFFLLFCRIFYTCLSLGSPPLSQKSALQLSPSTGQLEGPTSPSSAPAPHLPLPPTSTLRPTCLLPFPSVIAARRNSTSLCGAVARSTVLVVCGCMCPQCAGRMHSLRWCCVAALLWQLLSPSGLWLYEPCRSKAVMRNGGVNPSRTGARICESLLLPRRSMERHPISLSRVCNNNTHWLPVAVVNLTENSHLELKRRWCLGIHTQFGCFFRQAILLTQRRIGGGSDANKKRH